MSRDLRPIRCCGPAVLLWACLAWPAAAGQAPSELQAAARLAAEGRREEALKAADALVTRDPFDVPAQRLYQDLMLAAGRRDELLARYARAGGKEKNARLLGLLRYLEARAEPEPARRRGRLEAAYASDQQKFWAAYDLVELCTAGGDLAAAEKYARAARDARPGDADVRNVLGNVLVQAGKPKEAEVELAEALKLRPAFPEAEYNLGLVRAAAGKHQEAAGLFRRAVEQEAKFAEAWNNLGHSLARLDKPDEAIAAYRRAIEIKPGYGAAHNNLAVSLYRQGDGWGAWKHLQEAEKSGYRVSESFKRVLSRKLFPEKQPGDAPKTPAPPAPAKD
jgi:Flp pilus assembly protein TadD